MWNVKKILLPTDGSSHAEKAYEPAVHMAKTNNAELIGLYVYELSDLDADVLADAGLNSKQILAMMESYESGKAESVFKKLEDSAKEVKFRREVVKQGSPSDKIVETAENEDVDLIVMGTKGSSGTRKIIGSTAASVINHAHCPVLAVR